MKTMKKISILVDGCLGPPTGVTPVGFGRALPGSALKTFHCLSFCENLKLFVLEKFVVEKNWLKLKKSN